MELDNQLNTLFSSLTNSGRTFMFLMLKLLFQIEMCLFNFSADIISLQEVETDQFYHFFQPELRREGYEGVFSPKSRAKTMNEMERKHVDGCAIFYRWLLTKKIYCCNKWLWPWGSWISLFNYAHCTTDQDSCLGQSFHNHHHCI